MGILAEDLPSDSVIKRELAEISLFVLNRKTLNIRREIYEFLVLDVIHESEIELKFTEIVNAIVNKYKFKEDDAIKRQVAGAIDRLKNKEIVIYQNRRYSLHLDTNKYLEKLNTDYNELREYFQNTIVENISEKIKDIDKDRLINSVYSALSKIITSTGKKAIKLFMGEEEEEFKEENLREVFIEQFDGYSNKEKKEIIEGPKKRFTFR